MLKKLRSFFANSEPTNNRNAPNLQPTVELNTVASSDTYQNRAPVANIRFEIPSVLEHPPGIMAFTYLQPSAIHDRKFFDLYAKTAEKAHEVCTFFFEKSNLAKQAKDDVKQAILLWEDVLPILPAFTKAMNWQCGELPPTIECRNILPDLYKRLGQWQDAKRVIETCAAAGAYPNGADQELTDLERYAQAADIATDYIKEHPGVLQKDIYKLLANSNADPDMLKRFTRTSLQIRKEPAGKTNKLFIANPDSDNNKAPRN